MGVNRWLQTNCKILNVSILCFQCLCLQLNSTRPSGRKHVFLSLVKVLGVVCIIVAHMQYLKVFAVNTLRVLTGIIQKKQGSRCLQAQSFPEAKPSKHEHNDRLADFRWICKYPTANCSV